MTENEARQIIENFLSVGWNNRTPIAFDNQGFKSRQGISYIEPILSTVFSHVISANCQRNNCLLSIMINTPANTGSEPSLVLSNELLKIFVCKDVSGIVFKSGKSERIGIYKEWYQRRVSIEYHYNLTF